MRNTTCEWKAKAETCTCAVNSNRIPDSGRVNLPYPFGNATDFRLNVSQILFVILISCRCCIRGKGEKKRQWDCLRFGGDRTMLKLNILGCTCIWNEGEYSRQ